MGAVVWMLGGRRCALHSDDPILLAEATRVLRGEIHQQALASLAVHWWVIGPLNDGSWQVSRQAGPSEDLGDAPRGQSSSVANRAAAIATVEFEAIHDFATLEPDVIALHAALLSRAGRGVLVVGPKQAGKSTLAIALWRRGWTLHGDDLTILSPCGQNAIAAPRRVSVRFGALDLLGADLWSSIQSSPSFLLREEAALFHPHEVAANNGTAGVTPAAVVFLARRTAQPGPGELRPIVAAEALLALAPHSTILRTAGMAAALAGLQPLLASVPAFDLGRGQLDRMITAIEGSLQPAVVG
jgi:hypothetical protein